LIIFILSYLFVLPISCLRIPKTHNRTSLQVWHANVLHFCSFCKPTFSGAAREWDALYKLLKTASAPGFNKSLRVASDWLRDGWPKGQSSSPGRIKSFHFSRSSRPVLRLPHPALYLMGTGGSFPGGKMAEAWIRPLISNYCRGQENVDVYLYSTIRFRGVVLN
jgi:hypothetical protein